MVLRPGASAPAGEFAALLFSGGVDVEPARFGQAIPEGVEETLTVDGVRDALEWDLLEGALERRIPVLGICRGSQLLNVYLGGTLHLDMGLSGVGAMSHRAPAITDLVHRVDVRGGRIAAIMPQPERVNSRHHQAVATPGRGLSVTAMSEDGVIEAIESEDGLVLGVQWHPEAILDKAASSRAVFADLVGRASAARVTDR